MDDKKPAAEATVEPRPQDRSLRERYRTAGWRGTVALGALGALLVLVVNVGFLVWAIAQFSLQSGIATVFEGSCSTVNQISTATHLVINILSTLLLAASNTCMQVLVAPTREEIDRAHAKRRWLDVGVNTLRNLRSIDGKRLLIWVVLGLSSVPLHLFYNSVVFEITDGNGFGVMTVGRDFETGGFWNATRLQRWGGCFVFAYNYDVDALTYMQANIASFIRLENTDCIAAFGSGFQSEYASVLAVSSQYTPDNVLNLVKVDIGGGIGNNWVCDTVGVGTASCDIPSLRANAASWTLPGNAGNVTNVVSDDGYVYQDCPDVKANYPISHCLVEPAVQHCKVGVSVVFLGIVIACNLFKVVCLTMTTLRLRHHPLVTMGDAVESFLDHPDPSTRGACLLSPEKAREWSSTRAVEPAAWKPTWRSGFSAASRTRWFMCSLLLVVFWCVCLGLLDSAYHSLGDPTFAYIQNLGIGKPLVEDILSLGKLTGLTWLPLLVLVANLPQFLISLLYLLYNDLFTRMQLGREWTSYSQRHRPLRVTAPTGEQVSQHFLQLPFMYSIPLMIIMIVLHWLVSQSLFLTLIAHYRYVPGSPPSGGDVEYSGLGYSAYGIFLSLVVGALMILALWLYAAILRYPRAMPLARCNSAAISAACHRHDWDTDAARKRVRWGSIGTDPSTGVAHASFSSGPVDELLPGQLYA